MLSRYNRLNSGEFCETPSIESLLWNEEQQSVFCETPSIESLL